METYDLSMHSGSNVADFSYVEQMRYFQYLQEQMVQENELNAYVSECLCLSEGASFKELSALNEAISDKASNAWNKILDFLRRMWGKFTHTFGNLFNNNREYLNKYKDIILNKPIKAFSSVDMNDCEAATKRMLEVKLTPIDNAKLDRLPAKAEEETGAGNKLDKFRSSIVPDWRDGNPTNNRDQKDFVGWLSDYFKATDLPIKNKPANSLNMKDIFDFCYDGAKNGPLYKQIEKEKSIIESDSTEFEKELKGLMTKKEAVYSRVLGEYITEANFNKAAGTQANSKEDNSNTLNQAMQNRNAGTEKGIENNKAADRAQAAKTAQDDANKKAEEERAKDPNAKELTDEEKKKAAAEQENAISNKAKAYMTLASNICTAKLNGISYVYDEYMQIIKTHVASYVGAEKTGDTRPTQTGTNYNQQAGNTQQQSQAQQTGGQ